MLAFWTPGPLELIIVGIMGLVLSAVVIALVVVLKGSRNASGNNPNLKPCPDCGRFVSLRATTCPQCGCPLQTEQ